MLNFIFLFSYIDCRHVLRIKVGPVRDSRDKNSGDSVTWSWLH